MAASTVAMEMSTVVMVMVLIVMIVVRISTFYLMTVNRERYVTGDVKSRVCSKEEAKRSNRAHYVVVVERHVINCKFKESNSNILG